MDMDEGKGGCVDCIRYGFIMVNTLFMLLGICLLFLGVWFYAVPANQNFASIILQPQEQVELRVAMLLTIGVGTGVCIMSLVGCYAAFSSGKCYLVMVGLCLIILLVLEACIMTFGVIYQEQVIVGITDHMARTLAYYYAGDEAENMESVAWGEMQKGFECCGVNTTEGYKNHTSMTYLNVTGSLWYRTTGSTLSSEWPNSCCKTYANSSEHGDIACSPGQEDGRFLSQRGCADEIALFFRRHFYILVATSAILIVFEVLAMLLAYGLYKDMQMFAVEVDGSLRRYSEML